MKPLRKNFFLKKGRTFLHFIEYYLNADVSQTARDKLNHFSSLCILNFFGIRVWNIKRYGKQEGKLKKNRKIPKISFHVFIMFTSHFRIPFGTFCLILSVDSIRRVIYPKNLSGVYSS